MSGKLTPIDVGDVSDAEHAAAMAHPVFLAAEKRRNAVWSRVAANLRKKTDRADDRAETAFERARAKYEAAQRVIRAQREADRLAARAAADDVERAAYRAAVLAVRAALAQAEGR